MSAKHVGRFAKTIPELGILIVDLCCPFAWKNSPSSYWIAGAAIGHLYAPVRPQFGHFSLQQQRRISMRRRGATTTSLLNPILGPDWQQLSLHLDPRWIQYWALMLATRRSSRAGFRGSSIRFRLGYADSNCVNAACKSGKGTPATSRHG
jgi:hypothetical protein